MDPVFYDELIGDNEELQDTWDRICEIYEDMQSQGKLMGLFDREL